jgi:oligosaccharide amylase
MRPWLYSAILGNGRLLVCLDETGSLAQLFYPSLDAGPHIHSFLLGIQAVSGRGGKALEGAAEWEQEVSWLTDQGWAHELSYIDGTAVAHCVSTHTILHIQVDQTMCVHHGSDAFINEVRITNLGNTAYLCKLVIYADFNFDYRQSGNTCHFDTENSMLTFFAADRYVAITCDKPISGYGCDRRGINDPDCFFQDTSSGQFNSSTYATGLVQGSVCYDLGQIDPSSTTIGQIHMCLSRSRDDLRALSTLLAQRKSYVKETTSWWQEHYRQSAPKTSSLTINNVYNRSIITLKVLTDKTGSILAAPECDPAFRSSGGYGFCWPRDGAFIGHSLDITGHHDHARAFYDWTLQVQEASGGWYQRYYTHGALAPTWGLVQFDQIGAVVWAICQHIQLTEDISYGQKIFSQLVRACEYMRRELDPATGLAPITKDLWEERDGISTYACACTWAAFNELAYLATKLGQAVAAKQWALAASRLKDAIEKHLWSTSHQRFLRGINTLIPSHSVKQLYHQQTLSEADIVSVEYAGKTQNVLAHDATVDVSILGLSIPFGVFSAYDPRIIATAEAIARYLTSPRIGGIHRYQGDRYRRGNPWIICTLWLAMQYLNSRRVEQGRSLYNWALNHRTSLDLFPEQVDSTTGKPCWVVPLAWSHAMFLLATEGWRKRGLLP